MSYILGMENIRYNPKQTPLGLWEHYVGDGAKSKPEWESTGSGHSKACWRGESLQFQPTIDRQEYRPGAARSFHFSREAKNLNYYIKFAKF